MKINRFHQQIFEYLFSVAIIRKSYASKNRNKRIFINIGRFLLSIDREYKSTFFFFCDKKNSEMTITTTTKKSAEKSSENAKRKNLISKKKQKKKFLELHFLRFVGIVS